MAEKGFCPHIDKEYTGPSHFWCDDCAEIKDRIRDREQRRYEIARDCLAAERAAFFNLGYDVKIGAKEAVEAADALLKALEEISDGE